MTAMLKRAPAPPLESIAFLLVEHFSLVALAAALEPLRLANQLSGRGLFRWHTQTLDGRPVRASNGMLVAPDGAARCQPADALILCGGDGGARLDDPAHARLLREQAARGVHLGALGSGSWTLACAGLLDGYQCTTAWECRADLHAGFPAVALSPQSVVLDRDRYTAAGGTASLTMMLQLIGRAHGAELVAAIDETLAGAHLAAAEAPHLPAARLRGIGHPKLREVIQLMENNLEEPIDLELLASYIALSRRQLERLFQKHLYCSPSRYYLQLRLLRARQLLKQTDQPIVEVASGCGFLSAQSFSRCYREHFGIPPSTERPSRARAGRVLVH